MAAAVHRGARGWTPRPQMLTLAAHRIRRAFRHIRRKLPQVAGQEVGEDVVGGDASDPRLMGRGTDREAAAERDADDGHTIEAEVIEDSSDWPVPLPVSTGPESSRAPPWPGPSKPITW